MPQGCGERTGNLYNKQYMFAYIDATGKIIENATNVLAYAKVEPNTTYTVSADLMATNGNRIAVFDTTPTANLTGSNVISISQRAYQFTIATNSDTKYIAWHTNFSDNNRLSQFLQTLMLNAGSEPRPYEPYGYKIPISSANTTTPVYLGEVQTERKIEKKVFTGNELWIKSNNIIFIYNFGVANQSPLFCTHFANANNSGMWNGNSWVFQVDITQHGMSNRDEWTAFLQQQYTAGTPVTVWYVLATPQIAIVNEPLMKIGDYADEVSNAATIPTVNGSNTFDVDTTVKPSEVYIKYKGV
jgi:hypothetical protein